MAEPLPPEFFDFDNGKPMGKDQLKGMHKLLSLVVRCKYDLPGAALIYEECIRPLPPIPYVQTEVEQVLGC